MRKKRFRSFFKILNFSPTFRFVKMDTGQNLDIFKKYVTKEVTNSVKSFQLSKKYVQRLLRIGTINIIYQRISIPDSEFEPKNYENIPYMVHKSKSTNKFVRSYHVYTHGIIDAVEKGYLKDIFMYILDKKTGETLETYNFNVKYNKEALESHTKPSQVKNATVEFLQTLNNIPGEKWSSDKVELFMEFSYYENTPREYQPPNFEAAEQPLCDGHYNAVADLGSINTGFHRIRARGLGKNIANSEVSTPAPSAVLEKDSLDDLEENEETKQENNVKKRNSFKGEESKSKKFKTYLNRNASPLINVTDESNLENITIASSDDLGCLCKWDLPKEYETTRCTKCYGIVHLACHGYLTLNAVDENSFLCCICNDPKACTSVNLKKLFKLRIILYGIHIKNELPNELDLASKEESKYILGQLEKWGIYTSQAKNKHDINFLKLKEALATAFVQENSQYLE